MSMETAPKKNLVRFFNAKKYCDSGGLRHHISNTSNCISHRSNWGNFLFWPVYVEW
jgi:hypothetical protein